MTQPSTTSAQLSPADCWRAVSECNAAYDGTFVYAVQTTGIYCRPSCPSPQPKPGNVRYFALPQAAEQAGFRACRRCQPQNTNPTDPQAAFVQQVCTYLHTHFQDTLTLKMLGEAFNHSPYHLQRVFKRVMGVSPREYQDALRMDAFKARLYEGDSVTNALYSAGYGSSSRLYERTDAQLGMTPTDYQNGGEGVRIHFATATYPHGRVLVAATERGVCRVDLGDSADDLIAGLLAEYPAAQFVPEDPVLCAWVEQILDYLNGWQPHLDLPLDIRATAFQQRVWAELQNIPYGETRTYGDVAAALGSPGAAQAVGQAVSRNPVALLIPCHRVVRSDGSVSGYRWGPERKQQLLQNEQRHAQEDRNEAS